MSRIPHRPSSILAPLAAALVLAACTPSTSDRDLQPVTPQEGLLLAAGTPGGTFRKATKGVWVDPRSADRFDEAHIPGAISLPYGSGDFEYQARQRLAGLDPVIVYGDDYQDILANAASKTLIEIGFENVYTLRGGIEQWVADGHEVDGTDAPAAAGDDDAVN